MLWNFLYGKKNIYYFNAYSVSIRFQELKVRLKAKIAKTSIFFSLFLRANFPEILLLLATSSQE
jgi:hypothetical protein